MEMKNKVYKALGYRYQGNFECRSILLLSWGEGCKGNDFAKSYALPHEETRCLTQGKRCLLKRPLFYTNWRKVEPVKENPSIAQIKRYINLKAFLLSFADRGDKTNAIYKSMP